jgi:hypothetical protein
MPESRTDIVILANEKDESEMKQLRSMGYTFQSNEFVLLGILRQDLDYRRFLNLI